MKVKSDSEVVAVEVDMEGAKDVTMQVLIGPDDGSEGIIMRLFKVSPGGHTPHHHHNYEHLVRILSGRGLAIDAAGGRHELAPGQSVFVEPNEEHQFVNPFAEPLVLTCTIPG